MQVFQYLISGAGPTSAVGGLSLPAGAANSGIKPLQTSAQLQPPL